MKPRKRAYGDTNVIGHKVEQMRIERGIKQKDFVSKLQTMGVDINPTSYSKLEGQIRLVSDKEIYAIAKILGVKMEQLFDGTDIEQ